MKVSRIYRIIQLITMLQSGRNYTVDELSRELGVSKRTVFRDLNVLELAHIPYYFDRDKGGYAIGRHFFLPPLNLTLTEALSMLVLTGQMKGRRQVPLLGHAARAGAKLQNSLPRSIRQYLGDMIRRVNVSMGPLAGHRGLDRTFEELAAAIASRRVCRIVYISFHERKQFTTNVRPMRLVFVNRAWYLIAYSGRHRQLRTFKLGRIHRLAVTDRSFTKPRHVDLDEYFGLAWSMIPEGEVYDVHLHFEPMVAGNVAEVHWHSTQQVHWNDDGSAEFHVRVNGLREITWWILGYGDQVKVVSPRALQKRVLDVASSIIRRYRKERR